MKQKKRNWYMFFRKITLILASFAAFVGFVFWLPIYDHTGQQLIVFIIVPFFAVWGVYTVLEILYRLFRWAWTSTEESDTTDP